MSNSIARLARWLGQVFGPHQPGRHSRGRDLPVRTTRNPRERPRPDARLLAEPTHRLDADDVAMVRPYLVHHEKALMAKYARAAQSTSDRTPGRYVPERRSAPRQAPAAPTFSCGRSGEFDELARLVRRLVTV